MNVKRFFAATAREALRDLKEALGADAIVLSNRAMDGGVEILALPGEAVGALQAANRAAVTAKTMSTTAGRQMGRQVEPILPPAPAVNSSRHADDSDFCVSLSALAASAAQRAANSAGALPRAAAKKELRRFEPPRIERPSPPRRTPAVTAASQVENERIRELQEANDRLMTEMSDIRAMIERQLAGFAWGETSRQSPARAALMGELLEVGFSTSLARKLVAAVPEEASCIEAREAAGATLDRLMRTCSSDEDLINAGGVYALVGPTGVGKTTTTAKLAARCVVRHGANRVALITTDAYRIGAHEQLRIYGRILGVPVFAVRDADDLRQTLSELRQRHMVLIDTMGMSQRDRMVAEQAALLAGSGDVRRLLLLNATSRGDTLDDVVRAYAGEDLAGCILSKIDEAASLAPALDVAVRHDLAIRYLANGQRVPEDLHLPNRAYLVHRSMREQGRESPWCLDADETGMMLAAANAGG